KLKIPDLKEFKEVLFSIDGVEEVIQRALDKTSSLLEIQYKKDRASFERAIDGLSVHDKRITLKGVENGAVLIVLAPTGRGGGAPPVEPPRAAGSSSRSPPLIFGPSRGSPLRSSVSARSRSSRSQRRA